MKKIEKGIKEVKKTIEKLSKKNYFESIDLKTLASSLDLKTNEVIEDLRVISELKNDLKEKIKKIEIRRSELEDLLNKTNKLISSESKKQTKRKNVIKDAIEHRKKIDKKGKITSLKVLKSEKQEVDTGE